ncbi:glycoside hydrolase family 2 protein [Rhodanobacter sp. Si-c]|uniref:Beta-mannosidase B n=1 Tax=Rhodanobacter lycopersici TaxID=3162487 RepID=A0ABV3QFV4_9GAMM
MPRRGGWLPAILCVFALLLPGWSRAGTLNVQSLDGGWQFRLAPGDKHAADHPGAAQWLPATVPGTVQTDLLAAKLVPDPYWRDNEAKIQWVGLADWQYRTQFKVDAATLARRHVDLVFDGLDTFADVSLNGHKLLAADNMFRRWRVPAKAWLHAGANTLEVTLHSPIAQLQPWLLKQPYALPGEFDSAFGDEPEGKQTANYVRKAAYQYGWDWGPRIVTEGIWKDVRLESWSALRLADFHIAQPKVDADVAQLQAQLRIAADAAGKAQVTLRWRAPDGSTQSLVREVALKAGDNQLSLPFEIAHPQRWWPVGYGAPNLYDFHVDVMLHGDLAASAERHTGLRSVELLRKKDQWGKSFAFVVNGVPIFAKGANVIPMDSFPNRVTTARIDAMLQSARDANMNMLRVWGGGYYLEDAFYAEADRLGLMVWQDFMFGGAIPPYDQAFRDNTRVEAVEQVDRLRDHPSIVLWAGNNEVETAWETWGGGAHLEATQPKAEVRRIVQGMRELFDHTLRDVVATQSPEVPYWPSTPSSDYDEQANVLDNGDYHYWNVWSGKALPPTAYLDVTPRFQSEYGLQSFPSMATLRSVLDPSDLSIDSPVLRAHQKFDKGKGNQRLLMYVEREYGKPKDFAALVYLSQVMQAEGIQLAAEHLRASRPRSMGSLYWQLDDVWPGATWSSVDYYGRWKALQYHAKRFYAPLRVVAIRKDGKTQVSLVSDRTAPFDAELRVRVLDMDGKPLWEHTQPAHVAALASTPTGDYTDAQLLHGGDPRHAVAVFELLDHGRPLSRHLVWFDDAKNLALPDPGLKATLSADGRSLTVSARHLAREVWVDFGDADADARLSDNAFDLLPGESVTLHVDSAAGAAALQHALTVRSLYGATVTTP